MKRVFAILACLIFFACSEKTPDTENGVKPDVELFFQVYQTFVELAESDNLRNELEKPALMDSAMQIHGMSQAQFDTTISYLETHPEEFLQALEQFDQSIREGDQPTPSDSL